MFLAPCGNLFADPLIQRASVDQPVLELSAGRIGGFYQDKQSFLLLLADLDKRLHSVRTEIWIHRREILMKSGVGPGADLNVSQMSHCIGLGGRSDVSPA